MEEQGWIEQADQYGELLFVLEPANGTWGSVEAERDYLNICIGETVGNTAFDTRSTSNSLLQSGTVSLSDGTSCPVFTGHSCNYYVGYDEGCAVLESWSEGILFIDEINCVSETLAPTMLQFLQCKTFGNQAVPAGWVIVAAGNQIGRAHV